MNNALFGKHMRGLRRERKIGLREFCLRADVDPGSYAEIERGVSAPPKVQKLEHYRSVLGLEKNAPQWQEALRLAAIYRAEFPRSVLRDEQVLGKLPVLFRSLEGEPVDNDLLNELIGMLRRR